MFKVNELINIVRGKLVCGNSDKIIKGFSIDSRTLKSGEVFIAIKGINLNGHRFIKDALKKGAVCIIFSDSAARPCGNRIPFIRVQDTTSALGDIASYLREVLAVPVIAVTGSNGKTTAKEMISRVLSRKFNVLKNEGTKNNHIGLPMTLLGLRASHDFAVLEIGTNHFGEVGYLARVCRPNVGVITNIGPSHLKYFKSLAGVLKEKSSLLKHFAYPAVAVLNADDAFLTRQAGLKDIKTITFGIHSESDFRASDIKTGKSGIKFMVNKKFRYFLPGLGMHNIYNALAAVVSGRIFGMSHKEMALALSGFSLPQGRMNLINTRSTNIIDDTYNANPLSMSEAINALGEFKTKGRKILIMGDMLELGAAAERLHRKVGCQAAGICDKIITVGRLSKLAAQAARFCGLDLKDIFTCEDSFEAGRVLFKEVRPGKDDIVLVKGSRMMKMEEVFKAPHAL